MAGTLQLICMTDGHDMATSSVAASMPAGSMLTGADDGQASVDDSVNQTTIKCGADSVCVASVSLPASPLDVPAASPAIAPEAVLAASHVSFFTGGPDRPPRPAFA
jgi:hypothetical protein